MTSQEQSAEFQRRGRGPSNTEILGPDIESFPPTMDDIGYDTPTGLPTLDEVLDFTMTSAVGIAWENGKALSSLRWLQQLDDRLPPPSPSDHGVYLGYLFHLTAVGSDAQHYSDAKYEHPSTSTDLQRPSPVALKVQNVVDPNGASFTPQTISTEKTALQAYHVGCTRFNPQQILQIASVIISQIKSYNVFSENCQLFAILMAERTVVTRRNCSMFVGHIHQIATWDLSRTPARELGHYSRATGYVLANPRTEDELERHPSMLESLWLNAWRSIRLNRVAWQIAVLYRKGEKAAEAYDPEGKRTGLRYIWYRYRKGS